MRNRITVSLAGESYTLWTEEEENYVDEVVKLVEQEINASRSRGMSSARATVLASLNLADRYLKSVQTADHLRSQMKNYLNEAADLRRELADLQQLMDDFTTPQKDGGK